MVVNYGSNMDSHAITSTDELIVWLAQLPAFAASNGWGIGGSCLLKQLALVEECRDLDIVCTEQEFAPLFSALSVHFEQVEVAPHPRFCSRFFARFCCDSGLEIELMAGIAVYDEENPSEKIDWHFDSAQVQKQAGIPWMHPAQWHTLYRLFGRTASANLLQDYLSTRANTCD